MIDVAMIKIYVSPYQLGVLNGNYIQRTPPPNVPTDGNNLKRELRGRDQEMKSPFEVLIKFPDCFTRAFRFIPSSASSSSPFASLTAGVP